MVSSAYRRAKDGCDILGVALDDFVNVRKFSGSAPGQYDITKLETRRNRFAFLDNLAFNGLPTNIGSECCISILNFHVQPK